MDIKCVNSTICGNTYNTDFQGSPNVCSTCNTRICYVCVQCIDCASKENKTSPENISLCQGCSSPYSKVDTELDTCHSCDTEICESCSVDCHYCQDCY